MKDKILIAQINHDGAKLIFPLKSEVDWGNIEEEVMMNLTEGSKSFSVKFFLRTQKWLDKVPEYD
jgi:hypothetical protein